MPSLEKKFIEVDYDLLGLAGAGKHRIDKKGFFEQRCSDDSGIIFLEHFNQQALNLVRLVAARHLSFVNNNDPVEFHKVTKMAKEVTVNQYREQVCNECPLGKSGECTKAQNVADQLGNHIHPLAKIKLIEGETEDKMRERMKKKLC
jgi:hypothetical protein